MTRNIKTEFPDYPIETLPPIPEGWIDDSWRNNSCPSFIPYKDSVYWIFVDYEDQDLRADPYPPRFSISSSITDKEYSTDNWDEVLKIVEMVVLLFPLKMEQIENLSIN